MFKVHVKGSTVEELKSNLQSLANQLGSSAAVKGKAKAAPVVDEDDEEEIVKPAKAVAKKSKAAPVVDEDEEDEEDEQDDSDDEDAITHDSVKKLAQTKINAGDIDRTQVKKHVAKLGGNQISDLDVKSLTKLHNILNAA